MKDPAKLTEIANLLSAVHTVQAGSQNGSVKSSIT